MRQVFYVLLLLMVSGIIQAQTDFPIGQWRAHVPYGHGIQVSLSGQNIFYASRNGLVRYDPPTKEFSFKTKASGLSDLPVQFIRVDSSTMRVLVVYENGNMDILKGDQTINIPDVYLKQTTLSKKIYDAFWYGEDICLATSLGLILVNTAKYEIRNTFQLGDAGENIKVYGVAIRNGKIIASTEKGIKSTAFSYSGMAVPSNWKWDSGMMSSNDYPKNLCTWNNMLCVTRNDSLYVNNQDSWTFKYANAKPSVSLKNSNGNLYLISKGDTSNVILRFSSIAASPETVKTIAALRPLDIADDKSGIWIADSLNGLVLVNGSIEKNMTPNSPVGVSFGNSKFMQGKLLACSGGTDAKGNPMLNADGLSIFDGNSWSNYFPGNLSALKNFKDVVSATIDPISGKIYMGSLTDGIAMVGVGNSISFIRQNSFLSPSLSNVNTYSITDMAYDLDAQLWTINNGAQQGLSVLKKDGSYKRFTLPFTYTGYALSKLMIDPFQRIWMISPNGNGVICFDPHGTIDQTNDDEWRFFRTGNGNGNLPSPNVNCIVSDRNGIIWIGTDRGIGVLQCGDDIFKANCQVSIPVVQQDNFAGPLFGDENVLDIEVDGANRKWVATENGVWLISPDGQKVINKFTSERSPLLSNIVHDISINPTNGEVFFLTDLGICSYKGTATEPVETRQKPIVFPNPVPPGYNGMIAIKNLPENAWVRITEPDGKLLFQTRSLGGQAVWNGKNQKGANMPSGAYLVMVSDEMNTFQVLAKIFYIK